ncbi:MAG: methyltransferase domain-containing protein [Rhodobacteraceae bacterium]|nr:methyltransferase domain-containing protein [Paracoccaceae bacterium]
MSDQAVSHAELMDATYRYQRRIYDLSRRYFLLGRDHLIARLAPPKDASILEIACGTGRNLSVIAARHPGCRLFGLDISEEMLRSARAKLGQTAVLKQGDACRFDGATLFGQPKFDRIILSYSLSMIPDWHAALTAAAAHLAEGGELHVVDFGDQAELPRWFRSGLRAWLAKFHVAPRGDIETALAATAAAAGQTAECRSLYRDYARYGVLRRSGH